MLQDVTALAMAAGSVATDDAKACDECGQASDACDEGTGHFAGQWFCGTCWQAWSQREGSHPEVDGLTVMSYADFRAKVNAGAQWLIVDGTILDVSALTGSDQNVHKGGGDVLKRAVGEDLTGYFVYYHANLPRTESLHKPGFSHLEHVREKVADNVVGVLDTHRHRPPLSSPQHRFWEESEEKAPYHEFAVTSLAAQGADAMEYIVNTLGGLHPESPRARAFWAIVGSLVADAAAQPSHWNYKQTYFHEDLRRRGRFHNPEFMRPSMNAYYHIPMGAQSCYGDQALEVARSLASQGTLDPVDIERRFEARFGEDGVYGPLPQEGLYNGSKQSVRELPITGPWRHISIAGFLKNLKRDRRWPDCGTGDAQADCFVRVVPVVALYAGDPQLLDRVAEAVRLTQNNPPAIAVGQGFAKILEAIIMSGASGFDAISSASRELGHKKRRTQLEGFCGRVSDTMQGSLEKSSGTLMDAVLSLGGGSFSTSAVS